MKKLIKKIAVVTTGLLMVFQTNSLSTTAIAQTIQEDAEAGVSTYTGETYADSVHANSKRSIKAQAKAEASESNDLSETDRADSATDKGGAGNSDNGMTSGATNEDSSGNGGTASDVDDSDKPQQDNEDTEENGMENDDDETAEVDEQTVDPSLNTVENVKKAFGGETTSNDNGSEFTEISIGRKEDLVILSNAEPSLYQNATIKTTMTGTLSLIESVQYAGNELVFEGLGSAKNPYRGDFQIGSSIPIILKRALFNCYASQASEKYSLQYQGNAQDGSLFANTVVGGCGQVTLNLEFKKYTGADSSISKNATISVPVVGTVGNDENGNAGNLTMSVNLSVDGAANDGNGDAHLINMNGGKDSIGLIAKTVSEGCSLTVESLNGLGDFTGNGSQIVSNNANAGLFVGEIAENATFTVAGLNSQPGAISISAGKGSAGGVAGKLGSLGRIQIGVDSNEQIDLNNVKVDGRYCGGFIGTADGSTVNDECFVGTLKPALTVGSSVSWETGGLIGEARLAADWTIGKQTKIELPAGEKQFDLAAAKNNKNADGTVRGFAGGVFGVLKLDNTIVVDGTDVKSCLVSSSQAANYGGVVGQLLRTDAAADGKTLTIRNKTKVTVSANSDCYYFGGLVAWVGTSTKFDCIRKAGTRTPLVIRSASATFNSIRNFRGLGGAVGIVDGSGTVDLGSVTIATAKGGDRFTAGNRNNQNKNAGGVIGEAWDGAAVRFSGTTDISGVSFGAADRLGQLVGLQSSALLYANGDGSTTGTDPNSDQNWVLRRGANAKVDDVASNNEIIRLGNKQLRKLITVDPNTYVVNVSSGTLSMDQSPLQVGSIYDFIRLAIAFQTCGSYGFDGVTWDNYSSLYTKDIRIQGDIDLSGTGVTGLTRDVDSVTPAKMSTTPTFTGNISADNGCTIKLAIGEPYGTRINSDGKPAVVTPDSDGNGRIYHHNRLGLFASFSGNVTNLHLAGSIDFRGNPQNGTKAYVGALAGVYDKTAGAKINSLVVDTSITCTGMDDYYGVHIGSVAGTAGGSGTAAISFEKNNEVHADITVSDMAQMVVSGGVFGSVTEGRSANITVNDLTVEGALTMTKTSPKGGSYNYNTIPCGGFIGAIYNPSNIQLNGLKISSLTLSYPNVRSAGGMLGYYWKDVDVTFGKNGLQVLNDSQVKTSGGSIGFYGGLVYRTSGRWRIASGGIDLTGYTINDVKANSGNTSALGLLVCYGGPNGENLTQGNPNGDNALYLEAQAPDSVSLPENICGSNVGATQYDEWVASTVNTKDGKLNNILASGTNGVVSLSTTDDGLYIDQNGTCNTYVNKTAYGKGKTNPNTRYYYNLDKIRARVTGESHSIDTPDELLTWSVIKYANSSIRGYLQKSGTDCKNGDLSNISGLLDMSGYSYYPIDISNSDLTISGAKLMFDAADVEQAESGNKSPVKATQHMGMHTGLLRDVSAGENGNNRNKFTVSIGDKSSLSGTVSMMSSGGSGTYSNNVSSGALICGNVSGKEVVGKRYFAAVSMDGVSVEGLRVYNFKNVKDDYAPLLINATKSYTSISVNNFTGSAFRGTPSGTSLIGDVGGEYETQVSASFSNISLPSLVSDNMFTKASLLNSFAYSSGAAGVGSAYYNFNTDDTAEGNVTYGAEIDDPKSEYVGLQYWYYDAADRTETNGLITDKNANHKADATGKGERDNRFSNGDYLPYVYNYRKNTSKAFYHEIKVNQRLKDLDNIGCGTYADPYAFTNDMEYRTLSTYITDASNATNNWKVAIAKSQDPTDACVRRNAKGTATPDKSKEAVYAYDASSNEWKSGENTLSNDTMHRYLQSCYIEVAKAVTLSSDSFRGLGSIDNPFRGVVVGKIGSDANSRPVLTIKGSGTFSGLIPYSYGCVVRDLTIDYEGSNSIQYTAKDQKHRAPGSFFGGVFGNVLGGDNIIQNVKINRGNGYGVTTTGDNSLLVPVGGYVGVISGGGVIFRGSISSWLPEDGENLYNNPLVGRVLDGFAFSENGKGIPDNVVAGKSTNYKVNSLTTEKSIDAVELHRVTDGNSASKVTVKDAQGLLLLSAIINSGAAAGSSNDDSTSQDALNGGTALGTNAYSGKTYRDQHSGYLFGNDNYGKVRNASYDEIGKSNSDDLKTAYRDDALSPGSNASTDPTSLSDSDINAPHLVTEYAQSNKTMFLCGRGLSSMDLTLAKTTDNTYDMSNYETGYTGLSARYYSNGALDSLCSNQLYSYSRDRVMPRIAHINGNNQSITVDLHVKEYANDEFYVSGVGALSSYLMFANSGASSDSPYTIRDLSVKNSIIEYSYPAGDRTASRDTHVGGLAGVVTSAQSMNNNPVTISNVWIMGQDEKTKTVITGPSAAGGVFGSTGVYSRVPYIETGTDIFGIIYIKKNTYTEVPVQLYNSGYRDVQVSTISKDGVSNPHVGGLIGKIGSNSKVDPTGLWVAEGSLDLPSDKNVGADSVITCSEQKSSSSMGGLFGSSDAAISINGSGNVVPIEASQRVSLKNVNVTATSPASAAGGLVGSISTGSRQNIEINNAQFVGTTDSLSTVGTPHTGCDTGGLVGSISNDQSENAKAKISDCIVSNAELISLERDGACVGNIKTSRIDANALNVSNVKLDGSYSGGFNGISQPAEVKLENAHFSHLVLVSALSGSYSGDARGNCRLGNICIENTEYSNSNKARQGVLCGNVDNQLASIRVAGIEVRKGQTGLPANLFYSDTAAYIKTANNRSFVSFSNYTGEARQPDDQISLIGNVAATSPYVATSPVSALSVSDGSKTQNLFSDGANLGDGGNASVAEKIVNEATPDNNEFVYDNTAGVSDGVRTKIDRADGLGIVSSIASFNKDNPKGQRADSDFNVLQINNGSASVLTKYLNIVTNGAYADAKQQNGNATGKKYVCAEAQGYHIVDGKLVKTDDTDVNVKPINSGSNDMDFYVTSGYDNGMGTLTLITLTFSAEGKADAKAGENDFDPALVHKVMVPVVVRRLLQTTVQMTFNNGTKLYEKAYDGVGDSDRLLGSYGSPATALIAIKYNQEMQKTSEYGWDSYMAAGGYMGPVSRVIEFKNSNGTLFPAGTQFTLIDKDRGCHSYTYKLDKDSSTLDLSQFKDSEDENKRFNGKWMSELMGVSAGDPVPDGAWAECTDSELSEARAKIGDKYYRLAKNGDKQRYTLHCEKDKDGKELTPSDNYYLIVNIPKASAPEGNIDGYAQVALGCKDESNSGVNFDTTAYQLRNSKGVDDHGSTPRTYNFIGTYDQKLEDLSSDKGDPNVPVIPTKAKSGAGRILNVDVKGTVQFDKGQKFNPGDPLYYCLEGSLNNCVNDNVTSSMTLPAGSYGTAEFYVYNDKGQYFGPEGDGSTAVSAVEGSGAAYTCQWSASTPQNLKLKLPYNLANVREACKDAGNKFYVEVKIAIHISEEAFDSYIAYSDNEGADAYTLFNYVATLTKESGQGEDSRIASAQRNGDVKYYRASGAVATISLTSQHPSQLGINVYDLSSSGNGQIDAAGEYDLSKSDKPDELLANAKTVVYRLTLQKRVGVDSERDGKDAGYSVVENPQTYLTSVKDSQLGEATLENGTYTWIDSATDDSKTRVKNAQKFALNLKVRVNTKIKDYANYRLVLTAELRDSSGKVINTPWNANCIDNEGDPYARSDYVTYTYTRVRLKNN